MEHNYFQTQPQKPPKAQPVDRFNEDPDIAKLKKWTLYGLVGIIVAVAGITILIKIFQMVF